MVWKEQNGCRGCRLKQLLKQDMIQVFVFSAIASSDIVSFAGRAAYIDIGGCNAGVTSSLFVLATALSLLLPILLIGGLDIFGTRGM